MIRHSVQYRYLSESAMGPCFTQFGLQFVERQFLVRDTFGEEIDDPLEKIKKPFGPCIDDTRLAEHGQLTRRVLHRLHAQPKAIDRKASGSHLPALLHC